MEQNPYHHLDVFEHTLEALTYVRGVVEQLGGVGHLTPPNDAGLPGVPPLVPVSWAVLLHDIGKPAARRVDEEGRVLFWHHDEIGREMSATITARFRMSNRFAAYLGTLIRQHLRLGFLVREQPLTRRALARYRRDVDPWVFESVVVSLCDRLATRGDRTSPDVHGAALPRGALGVDGGQQGADAADAQWPRRHGTARARARRRSRRALDALEEEVEAGEIMTAPRRVSSCGTGGGRGRTPRWTRRPSARVMADARAARGRDRPPPAAHVPAGLLVRDVIVNDATVSEQSEAELRALLASVASSVCGVAASTSSSTWARSTATRAAPATGSGPTTAVIHLRMTGQLLFHPGPAERPPRFVWRLDPRTDLAFQDVRRFGRLWAFEPAAEDEFFARHGPGAVWRRVQRRLPAAGSRGPPAPLKSFLLDQRRIAGVGNIYADEALFRARLHPLRAAGSVGPREAQRLLAALLETLQAGIDHEGSSIESFVDPAGQRGSFQEILSVYRRTGEPCRVCGATVQRLEVGGRGTHYCPACQPRRGGMSRGSRRLRGSPVPPRGGKPPDGALPRA